MDNAKNNVDPLIQALAEQNGVDPNELQRSLDGATPLAAIPKDIACLLIGFKDDSMSQDDGDEFI